MPPREDVRETPTHTEDTARIAVRSLTGAEYLLVETTTYECLVPDEHGKPVLRPIAQSYRTAYAHLPVRRNDDGSFTIVDTCTRLVRIGA
jgi:hypothetical protein